MKRKKMNKFVIPSIIAVVIIVVLVSILGIKSYMDAKAEEKVNEILQDNVNQIQILTDIIAHLTSGDQIQNVVLDQSVFFNFITHSRFGYDFTPMLYKLERHPAPDLPTYRISIVSYSNRTLKIRLTNEDDENGGSASYLFELYVENDRICYKEKLYRL